MMMRRTRRRFLVVDVVIDNDVDDAVKMDDEDDDFDDVHMAKDFLQKAARNVDRLSYLIKDLDEISKLETGEMAINYTKFKLNDLIKEVFESMEIKAKQHNIKLIFKQKTDRRLCIGFSVMFQMQLFFVKW